MTSSYTLDGINSMLGTVPRHFVPLVLSLTKMNPKTAFLLQTWSFQLSLLCMHFIVEKIEAIKIIAFPKNAWLGQNGVTWFAEILDCRRSILS